MGDFFVWGFDLFSFTHYSAHMSDLFHKLLILRTPKIGAAKYNDLVARFGSVAAAAEALNADVAHRDKVMREMDLANKLGIKYIADTDSFYPDNLKKIKNHPPVISVRGNLDVLNKPIVSIVGTRHATVSGMGLVADIANAFADNGYAVASGMAMGTDTAAHRGALRANGNAQTIAVLAGGCDYVWPLENESLYWEIVSRGAIISEMPVGFTPVATNFVQRNRIVSGLCERLILGEADLKSGSMTTARFAIEAKKQVFAIPSHPADMRSYGPNSLIKSGDAILCMGVNDFFDAKNDKNHKKITHEKNESDDILLDKIGMVPVSETVLAQIVKKTISEIKSALVVLELQGLVKKVDGGYVRV